MLLSQMIKFLQSINLDAYILPRADNHLNEFISESDTVVKEISGFTGSNAMAVITTTGNYLYTDSRYFVQAKKELKNDFELKKIGTDKKVTEFLIEEKEVKMVGIDKNLIENAVLIKYKTQFNKRGIEVVNVDVKEIINYLEIKLEQRKFNEIEDLEKIELKNFIKNEESSENVTGSRREEKIKSVQQEIKENEAVIVTQLDSIAWLFNLRGSDIPYNPVFYSYAYIDKSGAKLFVGQNVQVEGVEIKKYEEFEDFLTSIEDKDFLVSDSCNAHIAELLKYFEYTQVIVDKKSVKNEIEIKGFKAAHIYDGIALCSLFDWMYKNVESNFNERDVSKKLIEFKKDFSGFVGESFETICGYAENSAIIHHTASDKIIGRDSLILIDSGTQYKFGTTDVTRTIHLGEPDNEHKLAYTLVLKGFLHAKMMGVNPKKDLDPIDSAARYYLGKEGLTYGHSTSHGVGHYLNVHESPPNYNSNVLKNQVMSIEPGLYLENKFGVRIEDLVFLDTFKNEFLKFESLTCVPFQLNLIDLNLVNEEEINYINDYSDWVRSRLDELLKDSNGYEWLLKNTEKISK